MKTTRYSNRMNTKGLAIVLGLIGLAVGVFMLCFRPHESWYDDAFWADWAYRMSQGNFITHVWGGGQPSYSPLYALLMAVWYKVVGFSYFTAQLPNLLFAFAAYLVVCLRFERGRLLSSRWAVVCFAFGYWAADGLFGIFTCGRVETLCLLLGVLTVDAFFRAYETGSRSNVAWMCLWSALQMWTGFEGVLFTCVVLLLHGLVDLRQSLRQWRLYLWYAVSSVVAFVTVVAFMAWHHCAKAFLNTMFGFSYTMQSIIHFFETGQLSFENNVPIEESMTFWERIDSMTIEGLFANKEYLVLAVLVAVLAIVAVCRRDKLSQTAKALVLSGLLAPWFFILAGRYAWYYTWVAYVPCLAAFCLLVGRSSVQRVLGPMVCVGMCVWFCLSPSYRDRKRIDFRHEVDAQNLRDIKAAQISNQESTYVPYQWYYYLAPTNDKLYFEGSGRYPKDMTKMVLSTPDEISYWNSVLEMKHLYDVGTYKVYQVLADKESYILK